MDVRRTRTATDFAGAARICRAALFAVVCVLFIPGKAAAADVATTFGPDGLTSLKWQGDEFVQDATPFIYCFFKQPDGTRVGGAAATAVAFDAVLKRRTYTYPWGSVAITYAPAGARLNIGVTVVNNTANPIVEFNVALMTVHLPHVPAGVPWQLGFEVGDLNIDDITAVPADYGTGMLLLCNDQPGVPLRFGFTSPVGNAAYIVRATTDVEGFPDGPQIAPGETRQMSFSFRFAPSGTDPESLIGDLHAALAAQMPRELAWSDRRAIGTVFLSNGQNSASPTNPRGWLNDPNIDTVSAAGRAAFHQQMLAAADTVIANLRQMNAQGMIMWDVEGEEYGNITYAGDPRRVGDLAPEMETISDAFFAKFINAGFRTGVCIRPSRIVPGFPGSGHVWDHDSYGFDILANLSDKITFAKNRWGCTLFYMDTNVEYLPDNAGVFTARLLRASLLRDLRRLHPDALIIPEIPRAEYWASTAPYREVRGGYTATPSRVRSVYPDAFTIIEPKDCDWAANHTALVNAVRSGDVLLFRSWFADAGNPFIKAIYDEAHPAPVINASAAANADAGGAFAFAITANNGPAQFSVSGLPAGLQLDPASGVISGTPVSAGTFAVTLTASTVWGSAQKALQLTVRSRFDQWRELHFPGMGNAGDAANNADPDHDGVTNFFEFAYGLDPMVRDSSALMPSLHSVSVAGSMWPAITFRRRSGSVPGANYFVEESSNLTVWAAVDPVANQVGPAIDQGGGIELATVRGNRALGSPGPSFLRLRVAEP